MTQVWCLFMDWLSKLNILGQTLLYGIAFERKTSCEASRGAAIRNLSSRKATVANLDET